MPHRLVTVGYVALVFGAYVAADHASEERSQAKLRALENVCNTIGNPGRALDRLDASGDTLQRREVFTPIVDCHRTYFENNGQPSPLDFEQQLAYVEWIRRGIRPVVRPDGSVAPE